MNTREITITLTVEIGTFLQNLYNIKYELEDMERTNAFTPTGPVVKGTATVIEEETYCVFVEGLDMMSYNLDYADAVSDRDMFIRQGYANVSMFRTDEAEALAKQGFSQSVTVLEDVPALPAPQEPQ